MPMRPSLTLVGGAPAPGTRYPALEAVAARGDRTSPQTLAELFGWGADAPLAALVRSGQVGHAAEGNWAFASAVHLAVGTTGVRVLALDGALDAEAWERIAAVARAAARDAGAEWHEERPGRALVCWDAAGPLAAPDPSGAGATPWEALPRGAASATWGRLLNDIQIQLHAAGIAEQPVAAGLPPVNALWFWGGGALRPAPPVEWAGVFARGPLARGLALHAGRAVEEFQSGYHAFAAGRQTGAWLVDGAEVALETLERDWCAPAVADLWRGRLAGIALHLPGAAWQARPRHRLRFWRNPTPLDRTPAGAGR